MCRTWAGTPQPGTQEREASLCQSVPRRHLSPIWGPPVSMREDSNKFFCFSFNDFVRFSSLDVVYSHLHSRGLNFQIFSKSIGSLSQWCREKIFWTENFRTSVKICSCPYAAVAQPLQIIKRKRVTDLYRFSKKAQHTVSTKFQNPAISGEYWTVSRYGQNEINEHKTEIFIIVQTKTIEHKKI